MPDEHPRDAERVIFVVAGVVIILAGLRAASAIVIPIVTAAIVAVVVAPLMRALIRRGVHPWLAFAMTTALAAVGLIGIFWVVNLSLTAFVADLPSYQPGGQRLLRDVLRLADMVGVNASRLVRVGPVVQEIFAGAGMLTRAFLKSIAGWAVVLGLSLFMLLEAMGLPGKLAVILGADSDRMRHLSVFARDLGRYMAILTFTSALTGITDFLILLALGVPSAALWGGLAFLFSYIPTVGFIATVIPPTIATLVRFGFGRALLVLVLLTASDLAYGTVLFPRLAGKGLNVAPFWLILSLVFWGWLFGPAGAILAIPLTMGTMFLLGQSRQTAPIAYLMSNGGQPLTRR